VRALVIRYGAGGWHASTPSLQVLVVIADASSHDGWERDVPAGTSSTADGTFDLHASEDDTGTLRVSRGDKANPRWDAVAQVTLAEDWPKITATPARARKRETDARHIPRARHRQPRARERLRRDPGAAITASRGC
jgi:hypothetical protein